MDKNRKNKYWIESYENHEDCFVVGLDQLIAEQYFCDMQGYDLDLVLSELICIAEFEENETNIQAYYPSQDMLIINGFEVITEEEWAKTNLKLLPNE